MIFFDVQLCHTTSRAEQTLDALFPQNPHEEAERIHIAAADKVVACAVLAFVRQDLLQHPLAGQAEKQVFDFDLN